MNIQKTKLGVDILIFIAFIIEAVSGFVLWKVLPRGSGSWIFLRSKWIVIHDWFAVALTILVIVHLLLNWRWIRSWFR